MPPKYFHIRTFALPALPGRVPIVAPDDCSHVVIKNGDPVNSLIIDTDQTSTDERQTIAGGAELEIRSNAPTPPFVAGSTIAYVSGSAGGPAIVRFTR